eukprot:Gb_15324 [translate_table: standard]
MGHQLYSTNQPLGLTGRGAFDPPMFSHREAGGARHLPGDPRYFPAEPVAHSMQPDKPGARLLPGEPRYFPGDPLSHNLQLDNPGGRHLPNERYMFGDRIPSERPAVETGGRLSSFGMDRYLPSEATQRADSSRYFPGQSNSLYLNGADTSHFKGSDGASFGSSSYFPSRHSTGLVSPPSHNLHQSAWPGLESRGPLAVPRMEQGVTGIKRPNEEVSHHQNLLGTHNNFGQNEALLSVNALAKRPRMDSSSDLPTYPQRPGEKDCVFYMTTRTCRFGAECKFDHPVWVPAGGIPNWKEVTSVASSNDPLPERPGELECAFYMKTGICKFGTKCKFNHPKERLEALKTSDQKGDGSEVKPVVSDVDPLPERPGEPECTFYMKTGICKFGAKCKFNHPKDRLGAQKTSDQKEDGDSAPLGGTGQLGTPGVVNGKTEKKISPVKPATMQNSKGLPIRPGETDCPFYIKTGSCKYGQNCRFNHPERKIVNPLPGIVPFTTQDQHLSAYPGVLPEYGLGGHPVPPQVHPVPPQRPGQPECVFYMKTGECKFGALCKFHHPLNRLDPSQSNVKLTLAGLPRREGETTCPFYMKTGVCKYGMMCKFDHPPPGEIDTSHGQQPVKLTLAGLPRREGELTCPFYMKTGTCKYGATCKFDHPPPGEAVAKAVAKASTNEDQSDDEDEKNEDSGDEAFVKITAKEEPSDDQEKVNFDAGITG